MSTCAAIQLMVVSGLRCVADHPKLGPIRNRERHLQNCRNHCGADASTRDNILRATPMMAGRRSLRRDRDVPSGRTSQSQRLPDELRGRTLKFASSHRREACSHCNQVQPSDRKSPRPCQGRHRSSASIRRVGLYMEIHRVAPRMAALSCPSTSILMKPTFAKLVSSVVTSRSTEST